MIYRLEVLNYRVLRYINVHISNFNILIGPNASGKTTFFDVLTLLKDILNESPQSAVESRASRFDDLVWNLQGNKFEIVIELKIPQHLKGKLKDPDFSFVHYEISLVQHERQGTIIEGENLWLAKESPRRHQNNLNIQGEIFPSEPKPPEKLVIAGKHSPRGWRKVISKSAQGNDYFKSETTDWNITYKFGPLKASLARIPEDEERFPATLWAKNILMEGIHSIQLNSSKMRKSCRPDLPVSFKADGSNLPKVIQYLKKQKPASFIRWIKHIQTAIPEIERIEINERPEDRFLYLNILQKNGIKLPSWVISDGTLRFLAQTLIAYLPNREKIYMIKEPENGLHPLAIESLFQSLSSVYDNQILLATHSPAILRLAEPKNILCFSKTESGAVDIVRGDKHPKLKDWRKDVDLATLHGAGVLQ